MELSYVTRNLGVRESQRIAKFRGVFPQIRGLSNIGAGHKAHTIDDLLVHDDKVNFVIFRNLGEAERSYYFCKDLCAFKKE